MALIGNRSVLHKSPMRMLGGVANAGDRSNFSKHGMVRSSRLTYGKLAALPNGYGGKGWMMPVTAGGVSSRNAARLDIGATGSGALGKNTSGTAGITFDLTGTGGLVSSASGIAALILGASGNIFASRATSGTASITLGGTGTLKATGKVQGTAPINFAANWTPYAVGWLGGSTASGGVLTEASIIAAMNANPPKVNIAKVNDVDVTGTGASGDYWGPA